MGGGRKVLFTKVLYVVFSNPLHFSKQFDINI